MRGIAEQAKAAIAKADKARKGKKTDRISKLAFSVYR